MFLNTSKFVKNTPLRVAVKFSSWCLERWSNTVRVLNVTQVEQNLYLYDCFHINETVIVCLQSKVKLHIHYSPGKSIIKSRLLRGEALID